MKEIGYRVRSDHSLRLSIRGRGVDQDGAADPSSWNPAAPTACRCSLPSPPRKRGGLPATRSIIVTLLLITGCHSQMNYAIQDRNTRVQDFIGRQLESNETPGIQYLALSGDSTLFSYNGGLADISGKRSLQVNTTMMIYSMSKTITAAAVLQLIEQGKIFLNDPITKYLNNIPYRKEVTIRHLLSQTSGIPNPIPLKWVHLVEDHHRFDERAAFQEILTANAELDFVPGKKYAYSNISYWLLGHVIEKASGTSYEDYVRQNIFRRLNIPGSEIDFAVPSRQNHAKGYLPKWSFLNLFKSFVIDSKFVGEYEDGWLHINDHYLNGPSFGGIVGSARAIGLFLQDQLRDSSQLFTRQTKALFFEQQSDNDGQPVDMSLGWHIGSNNSGHFFFKEGGGGGFHCEMRIYPDYGIASVVIANNTSFDAKDFLNNVDKEFQHK
jgi:D-alanyl-D-alanine carboxypeptidase